MHYNYANFLRDSSRFDLAKHHYRRALKLWPSYASAWNNLGTLIDDFDAQESHFLTAIYFSNEHINAHFNLGQLYRLVLETRSQFIRNFFARNFRPQNDSTEN